MGEFFGSIYCWLEDYFGLDLANYLWGDSSPLQTGNMYIGIGFSMLGISLFFVLLYYYLLNHPRLNNWWGWGLFFLGNALLNFVVAWQWVLRDYYDHLMVYRDAATNKLIDLPIFQADILAFAFTNAIDACIVFFIFSLCFKWKSSNCSHSPF